MHVRQRLVTRAYESGGELAVRLARVVRDLPTAVGMPNTPSPDFARDDDVPRRVISVSHGAAKGY